QLTDRCLGRRVFTDDPMELARERQAGRGASGRHDQNQRIVLVLGASVQRLVVLHDLPRPNPTLADEQHKGARLRKFVGQLLLPEATSTHGLGRKEDGRIGLAALPPVLHRLRQRKILRRVTQKPATHVSTIQSRPRIPSIKSENTSRWNRYRRVKQ